MKFLGIDIRRSSTRPPHPSYELVAGDPSSPGRGVVGYDAEIDANDYIGGPDINPEMTGYQKYEIYRQMLAGDPVVRSVSWLYKLPIRSAAWAFLPASDDGIDALIAECCSDQFGLDERAGWLDLTWDGWLQQSLRFLDWGAMFEEICWADDVRKWAPRDDSGVERIVRPIVRMAPRSPASIDQIRDDPRTGQITGLKQTLSDKWIEGDRVQHYVFEKEAGNWWGTSLLRSMFGAWKIKRDVLISSAIGLDRFAAGTPIVWHPAGEERKAAMMGREIRVHENGYVAVQGPKEGGDWEIDILNGGATWVDPTPMLKLLDVQIATAGLQMFAVQGTTDTGSRAVAGVLADPFFLAVQSVAKQMVEERMRQVLRRFVTVNFGAEYDVPKLNVSKVQARNVAQLVGAIRDLSAAGFNFTDRDTQDDVRDQLDLRHVPEGVATTIRALPPETGIELNPATLPSPAIPREGDGVAA